MPKKMIPADSSPEVIRSIRLKGFYITPFDSKRIKARWSGAVNGVEKNVNFDKVIKIVTDILAAQTVTLDSTSYTFELNTAREKVLDKYLDDNIMRNIDQADFVVTDWTTMNPNVLIEAGYAKGRSKYGLHLSADDALPSDRAGIIYIPYDPDVPEALEKRIPSLLPQLVRLVDSSPRVFDYYDERSTELVGRMIRGAKKEICILQTNLETINAYHIDDLRDALLRDAEVRILTLDPQSRYVNERALQLGYETSTIKIYRTGLQTCIDNTAAQLGPAEGFRMRLYNDFPNQLTYRFDDQILASVISRTGRSRKNCAFLLPTSRLPGPKHTFVEHFDQLWDQANQEVQ